MSRAAAYVGGHSVILTDRDAGQPGPGEVAVRPAFTGICGTDLHIFHGDMDQRVTTPAVLGHEMSGTVTAVGAGVEGWAPGDHVTVLPVLPDGTCAACLAGHEHVCPGLVFLGIDAPGAMQEQWVVPARALVRLPADLPLDAAALVEPTAVAVHDVRRAGIQPGEQALVVGAGPVGTLIALVARAEGADVTVAEPDSYRRSVAAGLGFRVLSPETDDVPAAVADWIGGNGAPVAFEVSGAQAGLETAVASLGVRGRLCLVAIHPRPRPVDLHRFFWRELTLVGARLYARRDFERAVELVASGDIPAKTLISRVEPLDRAEHAFKALEAGGKEMKILIQCATDIQHSTDGTRS